MTEKEKILRTVVKKLARLLHKQYMGMRVKKIGCICRACIIEKEALADTEDTGGEKCPECGSERKNEQLLYIKDIGWARKDHKPCQNDWHLPPKEQDDGR